MRMAQAFIGSNTLRSPKRGHGVLQLWALVLILFTPLATVALPLHTGDVNDDESRDVLDVNCIILSALSAAQGVENLPLCQQFSYEDIDLQCNDSVDVTDVQRLTLLVLHSLTGDLEIENLLRAKDFDLDYIHNDCDPDDDNDLFPDLCEIDNGTNPFNEQSIPLVPNACSCPGGCIIDSECIAGGTLNEEVDCLSCDGDVNPFGWSPNTGASCDDGNECTTSDLCDIGSCVGLDSLECDDGNECTDDSCLPATGCSSVANTLPCADGDPCTLDDQCADGGCVGGVENEACSDTLCVVSGVEDDVVHCPIRVVRGLQGGEAPGGIQFSLEYNPLEVEFLGFIDQLCVLDLCADIPVPPAALSPSGHNVIMNPADPADWLLGGSALLVNATTPTATLTDAFVAAGFITGDAEIMQASFKLRLDLADEEGALVQGTNTLGATTGAEPMDVIVVHTDQGPALSATVDGCDGDDTVCNDGNPCTEELCNPASNTCAFTGISGPACSDGTSCTINDFCVEGACIGTTLNCDDSSACSEDSCDPITGCVNAVIACDDGDLCTVDTCDSATGCSSSPVDCSDGIECSVDTCNSATGSCTNDVSSCGCLNDTACEDGNSCTLDECTDNNCVSTIMEGAGCEDGNACTENETCVASGACAGPPITCDDGDACTTNGCDIATGCTSQGVICDDGSVCTTDSCHSVSGCSTTPLDCDDGDACTTDQCDEGTECLSSPIDCDDGQPCTVNSCDTVDGCQFIEATDCDDENACTTDSCDATTGCVHTGIACDDDNPCTTDVCDPASGCEFTDANTETPCDDLDACTTSDSCDGSGECTGSSLDCNDDDVCTSDSCHSVTGCLNAPIPGCGVSEENVLCYAFGASGTEIVCDILMARNKEGTPPPSASQFDLQYDSSFLEFVQFQDSLCPSGAGVCFPVAVPPNNLSPSGHGASLSPLTPGLWDGLGTLILSNAASPLEALTDSYLDASGSVIGDTDVLQAKFLMKQTVPEGAPMPIQVLSAIGATGEAKPMVASLEGGILVFSLEDCNSIGDSACEDGDVCTLDECLEDGTCQSTLSASCDDGDPCTTGDTCSEGVCAGTPDQVCDDNDPCTEDTCSSESGCLFTDMDCDDGDTCTDDSCEDGECLSVLSEDPSCQPEPECDAICTVTGSGGTFDCIFHLAAMSSSEELAAALQFNLDYDSTLLAFDNFYDDVCFVPLADGSCTPGTNFEQPSAGTGAQPLYPSGHSITLSPTAPGNWVNGGSVVIANGASPSAPITEAYSEFGDGTAPYIGDTDFVTARFNVLGDTGATGSPICISSLGGADGVPLTLDAALSVDGVVITSAP